MHNSNQSSLIVQPDFGVLADATVPGYEAVREQLMRFAELERAPEHMHLFRITPLSLWNAAASGMSVDGIIDLLSRHSRLALPPNVVTDIVEYLGRYGRLELARMGERLVLRSEDAALLERITAHDRIAPLLGERIDRHAVELDPGARGEIKQLLVSLGYPPADHAGYRSGSPLALALRSPSMRGVHWRLRPYQQAAIDAFWESGSERGGSGVVVLPCGAGKTVVGIGVIGEAQAHTLILTPSTIAARQWIGEIVDKTTLPRDAVGEYTGDDKQIRPITVATYQVLTYRPQAWDAGTGEIGAFPHLRLFRERDWGLVIYDEVHLLPAPVFRATAELQARRRLGLTATLVREDGRERDVFSLIGPKKYDRPWRELERDGFIAPAECIEVRVGMDHERRMAAALAESGQEAYRIAAENPAKLPVLEALVRRHRGDSVLVIGQYLSQLQATAKLLNAPLLVGRTPTAEREALYGAFRRGELPLLVVSKVANFAVDLPDANVAIQISGTFGSRQEEAQRLGRILRPKANAGAARFYTIVTRDSRDGEYAARRQLFLAEQGYRYEIVDGETVTG